MAVQRLRGGVEAEQPSIHEAVEGGRVTRLVRKPCDVDELVAAVAGAAVACARRPPRRP